MSRRHHIWFPVGGHPLLQNSLLCLPVLEGGRWCQSEHCSLYSIPHYRSLTLITSSSTNYHLQPPSQRLVLFAMVLIKIFWEYNLIHVNHIGGSNRPHIPLASLLFMWGLWSESFWCALHRNRKNYGNEFDSEIFHIESPDCGMFLVVCHGKMGQTCLWMSELGLQWHMKEIGLQNGSETQLSHGEYGEEFPEMKVACSQNTVRWPSTFECNPPNFVSKCTSHCWDTKCNYSGGNQYFIMDLL